MSTIAVLLVHGIGEQKPGATLRQVGTPLIELAQDAISARGGTCAIERIATPDAKGPMSVTVTATLGARNMELLIFESRWAAAFSPATFGDMVTWLPRAGGRVLGALAAAAFRGVRSSDRWLVGTHAAIGETLAAVPERLGVPGPLRWLAGWVLARPAEVIQQIFQFLRGAVYLIGSVVVLTLIVVIGLIPLIVIGLLIGVLWKTTKGTASSLRSGLAASIGDAFTFEHKILDRAAMVQQVRNDLATVRAADPESIAVIAHSLGAAIAYGALLDSDARNRVHLFVTLGNALGAVKVGHRRRFSLTRIDPLPEIDWCDFYTSFDAVPAGELISDVNGPTSNRVANEQSIIRDHSGYFQNSEQVMGRILGRLLLDAGLEEAGGAPTQLSGRVETAAAIRRDRKNAQSTLSLLFVLGMLGAALSLTAGVVKGAGKRTYDLINGLLGPVPDPVEAWVRSRMETPDGEQVLGSLVLVAIAVLLYRVIVVTAWTGWDRSARTRFCGVGPRLYDPLQLWLAVPVLGAPILGLVGAGTRTAFGLRFTTWSTAGLRLTVAVLVCQLAIIWATHLTLETRDLTPRGALLRMATFLTPP